MSDLDLLWARYEQAPRDRGLLLALADEYLALGQEHMSDCLRWCVAKRRRPVQSYRLTLRKTFYWFRAVGSFSAADLPELLEVWLERHYPVSWLDGTYTRRGSFEVLGEWWRKHPSSKTRQRLWDWENTRS